MGQGGRRKGDQIHGTAGVVLEQLGGQPSLGLARYRAGLAVIKWESGLRVFKCVIVPKATIVFRHPVGRDRTGDVWGMGKVGRTPCNSSLRTERRAFEGARCTEQSLR